MVVCRGTRDVAGHYCRHQTNRFYMIFDQPFVLNVQAGMYMWERVEQAYNSKEERSKRHMASMPVRDVDSIRSKWKALKMNFRMLDIFGTKINFSYSYNKVYKTYEGATMTVLIVLLLIIIMGIELRNLINRSEQIV